MREYLIKLFLKSINISCQKMPELFIYKKRKNVVDQDVPIIIIHFIRLFPSLVSLWWLLSICLSRSSEDLVHRLFVCIAGVADQLQTNFASDLRNILKCVFLMNSSQTIEDTESTDPSIDSTNQSTTNALSDTVETGDNHDRQQETLPDYEDDVEETALTHDRSTQIY